MVVLRWPVLRLALSPRSSVIRRSLFAVCCPRQAAWRPPQSFGGYALVRQRFLAEVRHDLWRILSAVLLLAANLWKPSAARLVVAVRLRATSDLGFSSSLIRSALSVACYLLSAVCCLPRAKSRGLLPAARCLFLGSCLFLVRCRLASAVCRLLCAVLCLSLVPVLCPPRCQESSLRFAQRSYRVVLLMHLARVVGDRLLLERPLRLHCQRPATGPADQILAGLIHES